MAAATKNLTIEQKATFRKKLTYRDAKKKPINLTGFTARMQIRDSQGALITDLSTENGKIKIGGSAGTIELVISNAETSAMTFSTALYDLTLTAPNGDVSRILQGKITLSVGQTATVTP